MKNQVKNPAREKALDKIRKMYALANDKGASEGEIENALKSAQALMAKFNVEQGEVDLSPDDIDIELQDNDRLQCERKYWAWDLLSVIGEANDCQIIKSGKIDIEDGKMVKKTIYKIIGTRNDRLLTKELFNLTVPMIRNLYAKRYQERKQYLKENPLEAMVNPLPVRHFFVASYIEGFVRGLGLKLQQSKTELKTEDETGKYGLMVVKKDELIQGFIKNTMKNLKDGKSTSSKQRDVNAFFAGVEDGKDNHTKKLA